MNNVKFKRFTALLLAFVMVLSVCLAAPVAASAEATGNDGSAAMNEAYEAKESLMPIGPSFNVATLLEWTPESDPDARYSRASIPLANRTGGFVVNPKANPEAKLMLCSLANSDHDNTSAQGTESFLSWSFNYWQYADSFVYWSGSEEGLVVVPTGEFTDAAHTNGVPVVATLGFPWGTGSGYVQQVEDFCQQAEDGSFPVADKLLEVMEYYGFDGYFFNQESYGCSASTAARLNEMMRYMRRKCPDILISWYDSMVESGGVSYGNAVNDSNKFWMEADSDGVYAVDEFFMNYNWYERHISGTITAMESIDRSPYGAFAGLDVQQNCMNTDFRDHLLLDSEGKMKISFALYCPNSTLGLSADGAAFHEVEQDFYVNTASDPRVEVADATDSYVSTWVGMSRFFADKTPVTGAPFVTNFNSGHGKGYWVDGVLSRDAEWSYQSNQDVMPTWTWIIDSEGSKLSGAYDFDDAYNGGNSIKFYGSLDAGKANDIMLYSTDVAVADGMTLSLTHKANAGTVKLVAYYGDASTDSYEACEKVAYDLAASNGAWSTTTVDISAKAGKTLYALGIQVVSATAADVQVNLGRLAILDQDRASLSAPASVTLDEIMYHNAYEAESRIYWSAVEGATSYEVYKVNADNSKTLIMETPATALFLPTLVRDTSEENVTLRIVALNANGVRGAGKDLVIDWAYGNEDSEENIIIDFENVCLNAPVTGVSFENSGEPASKALDGTSANNSKWCATNRGSGWMSIDIGREVTVKRWRVEHAEYGGESNDMNTVDFALEYKDASGNWVQVKRIQNNHDAVTDVLLETPVTAQEWLLRVYDDGSSPWGGIRIYEWQMFETDQFPQTQSVMMHFASAANNPGATDTFTLTHVPVGQTVKLYTKSGDTYTLIGEQTASADTVTMTGLDFGTADAGRVYYTTTAVGSAESIKQSASFEAEDAGKSEAATNVAFVKFSQPGSNTSSNGDDIYTTLTVSDLNPGDVVYVYEDGADAAWTKMSKPVSEGETSVSIDAVRVVRAGGSLTLQVKRTGKLISDKYAVETPVFPAPTGTIRLIAFTESNETLAGVVYGVYNGSGEQVAQITTEAVTGGTAEVELGTYTLKCLSVPEDYRVNNTESQVIVRAEGKDYTVSVTILSGGTSATVTSITVTPAEAVVKKGETRQFIATVEGANDPDTTVTWSVTGAVSSGTNISASGLLTVGSDETGGILTVTATSNQDNTKSASATVTVPTDAVTNDTENVALNAEVIAYNGSKLGTASGPEKLFDGDKTDADNGKWCEDGNNLWVAFDIGEERALTEAVLYHAGSNDEWSPAPGKINTAGYELYVLNTEVISVEELLAKSFEERTALLADNSYWTMVDSKTDNLDDVTSSDLAGLTARILKVNISRTDTTGWNPCVRVYELELTAQKEPEVLSVDSEIVAYNGGKLNTAAGPEKLFDGAWSDADNHKWCEDGKNLWVAFDIGSEATVTNIKLYHAGANNEWTPSPGAINTDSYELYVLDTSKISVSELLAKSFEDRTALLSDNSYWTQIAAVTGNLEDITSHDLDLDNARIFKINISDTDSTNWGDCVRVYEVEVTGLAGSVSAATADKTTLRALIAEAEALSENDYTPNSWAPFAQELAAAKAVEALTGATQQEVDAVVASLQAAMDALLERANKSTLEEAIMIAEFYEDAEDQYTEETWAEFTAALEAACQVRDDLNATTAEVQEAYTNLISALYGLEEKPDHEHAFGEWVVTTEPTCTEKGVETRTCECGETETREIDMIDHSFGEWIMTFEPTCTDQGIEFHECEVCGETEGRYVDALGHDYESVVTAPTCTEGGYTTHTCSRCGDSYTDSETAALGHDYESVVVAPTETEQGYTKHTCKVCGHSYRDNYTDYVPEETEPEVTEPEVTEPEVTEPEVTEPEVTEPEVTEPEVTDPETTEPEVPATSKPAGEDDSADTGDTFQAAWIFLMVMSLMGAAAVLVISKKRSVR